MISRQLDKKIEEIIHQLVNKYKPEKIILFGSAASGQFTKDSDLDFLLIKKNVPRLGIERMRQVRRLVETDVACDLIVAKPSEIEERLKMGDPFVKEIMEQGKLLYG